MAEEVDFEIFSGNDARLVFTITDGETGDVLDLTGALGLEWAMAKSAAAATLKIDKTLGNGITITDAVAGELEVILDAADTEPLKGEFYHELRLVNSQSKKSTLTFGAVTVKVNLIRS